MNKQTRLIAWRASFGTLALTAIGVQLGIHMRMGYSGINFFSYFTNLSNLLAAFVFIWLASLGIRRATPAAVQIAGYSPTSPDPAVFLRAMSVANMTVVGVVFAVLLRDADLGSLLPWINFVLHYVMPVVVVVDWLLAPPAFRFTLRHMLTCLVFPLAYLVYVLVRGAAVGWYPYPFLNPANTGGYGGVAAYVAGIVLVFFVATWGLLTLGTRLANQQKA